MASSRIASIIGATGNQGASVVDALLKDGTFTPRAITRNPDSEASQKLKARGVEVVKADTADKASLISALQGSEAVFGVTLSVWSPDQLSEQTHGRNMIDASNEVGVKFFVFSLDEQNMNIASSSSTPNLTKLSGGKYNVPIYDDKADVEEYLKVSGLANASLLLGGFAETLCDPSRPRLKKTDTGFDLPVSKYSATELEAWTLALFKNYTDSSKNISGKSYPVVTAELTYPDLVALISKSTHFLVACIEKPELRNDAALGVEVTFTSVPTCGRPMLDKMYAAHAEYNGLNTLTPVPNPDLVGAKFGTVEEFVETELKERFG
ncbi:hypothetical protein B0H16DRAFT_1459642 [Mycena metata]|uniref:NmrA-like domain-containing protein n=1 Tax=Mycena metata TaxID=1033252 RepID=A0AAD7J053_9AGAR|nr:hypothetical protein B0H16DRAFT_1459642 [Mycena metata]